jgi:LemA protein
VTQVASVEQLVAKSGILLATPFWGMIMGTTTLVILGTVMVLLVWGIAIYNQLVTLANRYKNAFAQIEVQLKRRYDLIPNLVETAKGYLSHERETLEAVISARNEAASALKAVGQSGIDATAVQQLGGAETALGSALGKLNVVMEAYPDLKASSNMQQLSEELTSTENRVAFARQGFNDAVMGYNTYRQSFPNVVVAGWFGHAKDASLLEFADSEQIQAAPSVSFN